MGMVEIFQQAIGLTSTFNLWLLLAIFAITLVAEFGFSIPYLLEKHLAAYRVSCRWRRLIPECGSHLLRHQSYRS